MNGDFVVTPERAKKIVHSVDARVRCTATKRGPSICVILSMPGTLARYVAWFPWTWTQKELEQLTAEFVQRNQGKPS